MVLLIERRRRNEFFLRTEDFSRRFRIIFGFFSTYFRLNTTAQQNILLPAILKMLWKRNTKNKTWCLLHIFLMTRYLLVFFIYFILFTCFQMCARQFFSLSFYFTHQSSHKHSFQLLFTEVRYFVQFVWLLLFRLVILNVCNNV